MEVKPYKIPHPFRKLNKNLIDTLVDEIFQGSTYRLACECNGISLRIFQVWYQQGLCDIEHDKEDSLCAYLVHSLARVRQKEVIKCREDILSDPKSHKGAEWTLERVYWRDFSSSASVIEFAEVLEKMHESKQDDNDV